MSSVARWTGLKIASSLFPDPFAFQSGIGGDWFMASFFRLLGPDTVSEEISGQ